MLARTATVEKSRFEAETGWQFKAEGACKGDVCIPLAEAPGDEIDVAAMAEALSLPIARSEAHGLLSVGPESLGNRALVSAEAPELDLPDLDGKRLKLSSLRGQKIVVYAWAPY